MEADISNLRKPRHFYFALTRRGQLVGQVPINAVVSMGRRNTKREPPAIENEGQNRALGLDQPECCPG
jgi:hypothetical protein